MQTRHQNRRPLVWYGHSLAAARQAARFGRAHHTPVRIRLAFRLFPHAAVPDQQNLLISLSERLHALSGLLPQQPIEVVGRPVWAMDQVADSFGACRCLSGREQVAAQLSEHQPQRTMTMGEDDLHQIERRLHQPDVQVRGQLRGDRLEKLDQVCAQPVRQNGLGLRMRHDYVIMSHRKPPW